MSNNKPLILFLIAVTFVILGMGIVIVHSWITINDEARYNSILLKDLDQVKYTIQKGEIKSPFLVVELESLGLLLEKAHEHNTTSLYLIRSQARQGYDLYVFRQDYQIAWKYTLGWIYEDWKTKDY